jgi:hypothetical protein
LSAFIIDTGPQAPAPESDEDFENCKGRCGYTQWCRACMEERKALFDEAERKEANHVDDQYAENTG